MSPSTRSQSASLRRRSHATRTAEMRGRVLTAVVESIADIGFQRTTAAEIARRAGVTWGAVQHHFGDKDGILMAVLEESFQHFATCLGGAPDDAATVDERVAQFVDRSWVHFSSPLYRSTFQILINLPVDPELSWQKVMLGEWTRVWSQFFCDGRRVRQRDAELMQYTISVFSGFASTQMLGVKKSRLRAAELEFLKQTLKRELEGRRTG